MNSTMIQSPFISIDEIRTLAPSVFAEHPATDVSSKYKQVRTIDVVEHLQKLNWLPVKVQEQAVRNPEYAGYQKHMIRFRHQDSVPVLNNTHFEVVMVNSHNRSCAYSFQAGLFRLICMNGMVVADSTLPTIRVKHIGDLSEIENATYELIESIPTVQTKVNEFNKIEMMPNERLMLAESSLLLRYDELKDSPIAPETLLRTRRSEDNKTDLWHTYNTIQENLLKGGQRSERRNEETRQRIRKMSNVKSISENVKLNKALWHLMDKFAELKSISNN